MSQPQTPIRSFADAERVLADRLPGYTERPQQQALAAFVEEIIATGGHGLAEAGCGTGKSLATMIPAILGGKKTVIATATIALMEQYANKDVPFLEENLGVPFTWALVKGRSNYFCRAKAATADQSRVPNLRAMLAELEADENHSGDREHFEAPVTKEEFSYVASSADECPGKRKCPFGEVCFAEAAKQKGKEAQVVVTNTAMLMTDLKVREMTDGFASMLGDYDLVLIDEGHETEDIATNALAADIRPNGVLMLLGEARTFAAEQHATIKGDRPVAQALSEAWETLGTPGKDAERKPLRFFVDNSEPFMSLVEALANLAEEIDSIRITSGSTKEETRRTRLVKRANNYADKLAEAATADDEILVRWTENWTGRNGQSQVLLKTAPVHIGSYLASWLWDMVPSVLISATLSVGGDFSYIAERLGLPETTQTLNVGTPFDYTTQAMLFTPERTAPSPKDRNAWLGYSRVAMQELISAAGGGALLLFTSRAAMQAAYDGLSPWLEGRGFTALVQGQGSNKELAQQFKDDTHSVLFALKSFFTGVDFQGDTCRLVIIDKLPFPVPTEPVFAARSEQVERHGGSSFRDLTIPAMTLTLVQGYGRLIRTSQDKGIVAILDSRLTSTSWGAKIVKGLPGSPRTTSFVDAEKFFAG
jgi:ATP-dependent DNA helicase DinG